MSAKVVVPVRIISHAARRVPQVTNSGVDVGASAGQMYFVSQTMSSTSSATPRKSVIGTWVWVLTRPGITMPAGGVDRLRGGVARRELARGTDGHDALALHRHRAVLDHAERRVHGHDRAAGEQQVHGLAGARPGSGDVQDRDDRQQQRRPGPHGGQY